jgi:hypothetical protein
MKFRSRVRARPQFVHSNRKKEASRKACRLLKHIHVRTWIEENK